MAPKSTKRAAPAGRNASTLVKTARIEENPFFQCLIETVGQAEGLPQACQAMLVALIPGAFGDAADARDEVQAVAIEMLERVVEQVRSQLRRALEAEEAVVVDVEREKRSLDSRIEEAESAQAMASEAAKVKQAALDQASKTALEKQVALSEAQAAERDGSASHNAAVKEKEAYTAAFEVIFKSLQDGNLEAAEATRQFDALLPIISKIGLEDSLLTAFASSCMKPSDARGAFDQTVVSNLAISFTDHIATLESAVAASAPAAADRAAAVESARGLHESAGEAMRGAAAELSEALAAQQQASASVTAALEAAAAYAPEYRRATRARDEKARALDDFETRNVGCLTKLKDGLCDDNTTEPVPKVVPEPAPLSVAAEVAGA